MKGFLSFAILVTLVSAPSVRAQEEETTVYFPSVVSLWLEDTIFEDIFMLHNHEDHEVQATLRIYTNEGLLNSEKVFDIPGGELASLSYFVFPFQFFLPTVQGWGALTLPAGSAVQARHRLSATRKLFQAFASATTEAVPAGSVFRIILPNIVVNDLHGIAIVNPSPDEAAEVQLEFRQHNAGQRFRRCDESVSVPALHRVSRFVEHDLCEDRSSGVGWPPAQMEVTLRSDLPVAVSAMEFFPETGGFSALPVEILED